jgi:P27 family predicted phage terminase small subunit
MKLKSKARSLYRELLPSIAPSAIALLQAYCRAYQEFLEAAELIDKGGRVLEGANGYLQPHPATALLKSAISQMNVLAKTLGLNADRAIVPEKWAEIQR